MERQPLNENCEMNEMNWWFGGYLRVCYIPYIPNVEGPRMMGLGKGDSGFEKAMFGIYVKFLGLHQ